jgi:hypothetical protein
MLGNLSNELQRSFSDWSGGMLTGLLIAIGITYIAIGVFSQNKLLKAGAAAYGLLP